MTQGKRIRRFSVPDRLFHLSLMITFLLQTATGFGRLYISTAWGKKLCAVFGGYASALEVHKWVGIIMIIGFLLHTFYLLFRIRWKDGVKGLFGPDSLLPNLNDFKHLGQRVLWFFGAGSPPRLERWAYWEKFDYWAVYWGLPLLAVTGLMAMFPLQTSRIVPGWTLNISSLIHRAEALLAVSYIFIIHFFIGHLRPSSFPMNEGMFAGSVPVDEAEHEKPEWVDRLKREGRFESLLTKRPAPWFRGISFVFGYAVLFAGVYLLINGIVYGRYISLH